MAAPEDTDDQNYTQQSAGNNHKPSSPTGNSGGDGFPENHFNKKSPTKNYGKSPFLHNTTVYDTNLLFYFECSKNYFKRVKSVSKPTSEQLL